MSLQNALLLITGITVSIVFIYFKIVFILEKEYRAAKISFLFSLVSIAAFLFLYFADFYLKNLLSGILLAFVYGIIIVLFVPFKSKIKESKQIPRKQFDERDIMFSRNELSPGSEKYNSYYSNKPELENLDNKFREKPGLLSNKSTLYHPFAFATAQANLEAIELLKPHVNGKVSEIKQSINPDHISNYIKVWAKTLGVHSIGITELKNYHLYSHKGRRDLYGKEINNTHRFAIAFTVEMNHEIMQTAPKGPVIMESTQQYLNSGTIAVRIAYFIRGLGYSARAHIDGNYEVICPLVARDAGLGEIGRMGLLMTPKLGPRVRIAVVTADIPLMVDLQPDFSSTIDFCTICKKCALACPSQSISHNSRKEIDGVMRWKINSESCFTYWCTIGTDCGRCIAVCPYSHPNNFLHNFIRWGIRNSYIFRRFALIMDHVFYGKKPKSRNLPDWIDI